METHEIDLGAFYRMPCPDSRLKALEGKITDVGNGWIEGYSAVFNNIDNVGDRILPGAFRKTIQERVPKRKVRLMLRHLCQGGDTAEVIGTAVHAKEDQFGLFTRFDLSSVASAQDTRIKVLEGHVDGLSIGYKPIRVKRSSHRGKAVNDLHELAWYESVVTMFPTNDLAMITAAKSMIVKAPDSPEGRVHAEKMTGLLAELEALVREGPQIQGKKGEISPPCRLLLDIEAERRKLFLVMEE